ncbi:MAG: competence/damage-inducible protein A [Ruminococcaceae bacterium]|nr:competence/damage-inducible protein A [Oscillospiraceae bacterium]
MNQTISRAEILCVGTELLMGDIVNTNAAYLSRRLATLGIGVYRQSVVGDNRARLAEDLRVALSRADLVITSGGLGPTADDMTKEVAAEVFGRKMHLHEPSLARIERYFAATGREMTPNNRKQAMMPEGATVFQNDYGTAPALALTNEEGKVLVMLPGPPRELEPLFCEQVEPFLQPRCAAVLFSRNVHICGMGESAVESVLPRELLDGANPTVAPYCVAGEVRLRVTAKAADKESAMALCDKAVARIRKTPVSPYIYAIDTPSPEAALIGLLRERGMTVATAESCTGGLIAKRLTDVAGSSAAVVGGAVTYQTHTKTQLLGVPADLIEEKGVVSADVAAQMARGAREKFDADLAIATTGYAGPGGGTDKEPVGTVYIAVASKTRCTVRRFSASPLRDRAYIRTVAATNAILDALHLLSDVQ